MSMNILRYSPTYFKGRRKYKTSTPQQARLMQLAREAKETAQNGNWKEMINYNLFDKTSESEIDAASDTLQGKMASASAE